MVRIRMWKTCALLLTFWTAADCGAFDLTIALNDGSPALSWPDLGTNKVYTLQHRADLAAGLWQPLTPWDSWPTAGNSFLDATRSNAVRLYRLAVTERGKVVSAAFQENTPQSTLDFLIQLVELQYGVDIPFSAAYAVDAYRIDYETLDGLLGPTLASGVLFVPVGLVGPADLLSYQHGTVHRRIDAPSNPPVVERAVGMIAASHGYVVAMPDYIGLGSGSTNVHPYVHRRSSATAVVDMLRAARACFKSVPALQQTLPQGLTGNLFLFGYSQGAYVTLAAQKEIETKHAAEFPITASAPSDGPYDLSGTMAGVMTWNQPYSSPNYLPYVLVTYNTIYNLYTNPVEVMIEPYARTLPPLFDGNHTGAEIDAQMPASKVPGDILQPGFRQAFANESNHPFRAVLRENDLLGWAPVSSTRLYHCAADDVVPYANAAVAYASFVAAGADTNRVRLIDPNPSGTHGTCLYSAVPLILNWFDSLR